MPSDTFRVPDDVATTLMFDHGLLPYDVPWKIEGKKRVYATDAESAKALVDAKSPLEYAEEGSLETFKAEVVAQ